MIKLGGRLKLPENCHKLRTENSIPRSWRSPSYLTFVSTLKTSMTLGMHTTMQRAKAERIRTATPCRTPAPFLHRLYPGPIPAGLKMWMSTRSKEMVDKTPTTILVGIVLLTMMERVTCTKMEPVISPSTLLHLRATHKDIVCHQNLLSNSPPTHAPAILQLRT